MIFLSLLPILVKARESSVHPPFPAETIEGNFLIECFMKMGSAAFKLRQTTGHNSSSEP